MKERKDSGFSMVEVIIVLAIAALIIVIVLLTLPGLMRQQRNMERRGVATMVLSAYSRFVRNGGQNATAPTNVVCYGSDTPNTSCPLDSNVTMRLGMSYMLRGDVLASEGPNGRIDVSRDSSNSDLIKLFRGARCGEGNGIVVAGSGYRQTAAVVQLEGTAEGGAALFFCQNS